MSARTMHTGENVTTVMTNTTTQSERDDGYIAQRHRIRPNEASFS
jgi:hypothetical protein